MSTAPWFADTFFFLALLNAGDGSHRRALSLCDADVPIVTSEFVLIEVADGVSRTHGRSRVAGLFREMNTADGIKVVPCSSSLFKQGLDLYARRRDKEWSLTDCTSFVIMEEFGLEEALTGDRHFVQAGFQALLLN
ncbi:MAG TPA: PIN domain-containing protein [Methylomirabilota bacterium]|nr:PIN domain-containing protein [Methylomirabilota bacterium]